MANEQNLIPLNKRTKSEQRKIARKGGKKSGEVRREKKLLSQIYGELLADKNGIDGEGKTLDKVAKEILNNPFATALSSKVAMLKEIREATEGSKSILMNPDGSELLSKGIKISFEEPGK